MSDANKPWSQKDKQDFAKGMEGSNPFAGIGDKIKGYLQAVTPESDSQCPHCGQSVGKQINYPQGASK